MLEGLIVLASYGFSGGGFGEFLAQAEQMGLFSYILPFLLIFALVNGILTRTKLFDDNKAISGIISFVVGLMALQFDTVPLFFSVIFPKLGVGLAVILVVIILLGLFMPYKKGWITYLLFGIGAIILIAVLSGTAGDLGWSMGYIFREQLGTLLWGIVFIVIVAIIANMGSEKDDPKDLMSLLTKPFH